MARRRVLDLAFSYILSIIQVSPAEANNIGRDSREPDPSISNGTCFFDANLLASLNFIPCGNTAFGTFACCEVSSICLDHNFCYSPNTGSTYVVGCTDPNFEDPSCPNKSPYISEVNLGLLAQFGTNNCDADATWVGVTYCSGTSNRWTLCDESSPNSDQVGLSPNCSCPEYGSPLYFDGVAAPNSLFAHISLPGSAGGVMSFLDGYTQGTVLVSTVFSFSPSSGTGGLINSAAATTAAAATSAAASDSSVAVPGPAQSPSQPGLSNGAKAGIGIGAALGGCMAVSLISFIAICIRRRKQRRKGDTLRPRSEVEATIITKQENRDGEVPKVNSKRQHCVQYVLSDSWTLEYVAMAISIIALICIAVMLSLYDQKTLSSWSHIISLNTALSSLGTIMKGFLMIPVCSCLGQLKWLWFSRNAQALHDFQLFDQASRGPWGSTLLLFRLKVWHLASIGASVTLLALASDSFVQQSVSYPSWKVPRSQQTASVPYAQAFRQYSAAAFGGNNTYVGEPMMAAMYDGVFSSNLTQSSSSLQVTCATGNCTFPPYLSLGVCSQCADVSSKLQSTIAEIPSDPSGPGEDGAGGAYGTWFTLPNGLSSLWTDRAAAFLNMSSPAKLNSDALSAYLTPGTISTISVISGTYTDFSTYSDMPFAVDCVWYFCVRSYNSSSSSTYFQENITSTYGPVEGGSIKNGPLSRPSATFELPSSVFPDIKNQNRTFGWDPLALKALQSALQTSMTGTVGITNQTEQYYTSDIAQGFYYQGIGDIHAIVKTVSTIAEAFTNTIRKISQEHVTGTAYAVETHIVVQWLWLLLPLVMVLLATAFLGFTIWQSGKSGIPSWRSSALAVMEHGINTTMLETAAAERVEVPGAGYGKETVGELESWAKAVDVRLQRRGVSACGFGLVNT